MDYFDYENLRRTLSLTPPPEPINNAIPNSNDPIPKGITDTKIQCKKGNFKEIYK